MIQRGEPFLIVGAAKSGTTSLYQHLLNHPDIVLSKVQKEGRYFSHMSGDFVGPGDEGVNNSIPVNYEEYLNLFDNSQSSAAVYGDVSPDYLFHYQQAIPEIQKRLGNNVKIIIILRNPIDRALSQYSHFVREGREDLSFSEALDAEDERKKANWEWAWQYRRVGEYYVQVKAYIEAFEDVKIFLYDDIRQFGIQSIIDSVCEFIGVSSLQIANNKIFNKSGIPANNAQTRFYVRYFQRDNGLKRLLKLILPKRFRQAFKENIKERLFEQNFTKPEMSDQVRSSLKEYYKEDISNLQSLIKRDLSNWMN